MAIQANQLQATGTQLDAVIAAWQALLAGELKGDKGDTGNTGAAGRGISSITKSGETVTVTYTDDTTATFTVPNGAKGDTGEKGDPFTYADFTEEQLAALVREVLSDVEAASGYITAGEAQGYADTAEDNANGYTDTAIAAEVTRANAAYATAAQGAKADTALQTHQDISGKVNVTDIVNNLVSTLTDRPLSAAQGKALNDLISAISALIAPQATAQNQLADKAFVNSSVQTATANFRGNWATWADVPTDGALYPTDYSGEETPSANDYMVVVDASDVPSEEPLEGTWRFKYSGEWATDGKDGWYPEYQVNETPLTSAQLAAINSNATAAKVAGYDDHVADDSIHVTPSDKSAWNGKAVAPTVITNNISGTLALTAVDNAIYAPSNAITAAVTISAKSAAAGAVYGIDIVLTVGSGGSVTISALSTSGENIGTAKAGETWEINILRGRAVVAKLA